MEALNGFLGAVNSFLWGPYTLAILAAAGIYLTVGLGFLQFRKLGYGFSQLFKKHENNDSIGDITPFASLMTALSATIGTGNIAGVATAIALGGPGAVFYMWLIALIGMATKYTECMLAVEYREKNDLGEYAGGPMYYIKKGIGGAFGNGLGKLWAVILLIAAFGIGNGVQSNSLADALDRTFAVPEYITGTVLAILVGIVIIGGIKRIANVASRLVPTMFVVYMIAGLIVIIVNIGEVGNAFALIFKHALGGDAAVGGAIGVGVAQAMRFGFARGVFSNEAGMGSAPIAHAAAQTKNPIDQAHIAMLGTFIDTILVCTVTALVIITSGAFATDVSGVNLTIAGFESVFGAAAGYIVTIALAVFVFTTIMGWNFYGERGLNFLGVGKQGILVYRVIWIGMIFFSSFQSLGLVWNFSDSMNALMIYPNVIALVWLSPIVFRKTKEFWAKN